MLTNTFNYGVNFKKKTFLKTLYLYLNGYRMEGELDFWLIFVLISTLGQNENTESK